MKFQEFVKGMDRHFGIRSGVQEYVDTMVSAIADKILMDIVKFDEWLHEQHGEYEKEKGMSMAELLKKEYGQAAHDFVVGCM